MAWPGAFSGAIALAGVVYVAAVHRGLGAPPGGMPTDWWHPTGFLLDWDWFARWHEVPWIGIALITAPVAVLQALLFARPAPALARATAASATATVAIMGFYGLAAFPIWSFFHWRGSAVMIASGLVLGCTLAAPDLARSLRRRPALISVALYVPAYFAVSALIRNATGWDPALDFNISPWPAIPVLALEIGAYTWVGMLLGLAVGVASFVFARTPVRRTIGVTFGVTIPLVWFAARFGHVEPHLLGLGLLISATVMAMAVARTHLAHEGHGAEWAISLGLAAALIALPLATGRALADGDYAASKHLRAREIIDALAIYYEYEGEYPESLGELVDLELLDSIPEPRVGSGFWTFVGAVDPHGFDYANLGSSYVLEFVATEWIMCSYNPPWDTGFDEEEEADDEVLDQGACLADCDRVCRVDCDDQVDDCSVICGDACGAECTERAAMLAASASDDGGEAWSCPDARPELW